MTSEFESRL